MHYTFVYKIKQICFFYFLYLYKRKKPILIIIYNNSIEKEISVIDIIIIHTFYVLKGILKIASHKKAIRQIRKYWSIFFSKMYIYIFHNKYKKINYKSNRPSERKEKNKIIKKQSSCKRATNPIIWKLIFSRIQKIFFVLFSISISYFNMKSLIHILILRYMTGKIWKRLILGINMNIMYNNVYIYVCKCKYIFEKESFSFFVYLHYNTI